MKAEISTRDPDRFFRLSEPGSQEWWYFDAVSQDGRDSLVIVWYAALPFDPLYGVAALKHLSDPQSHPAPDPLDHCAIGLSWYRDGKTLAYALNGFRKSDFAYRADPFVIDVAGNRLGREANGYRLSLDTPAVDGRSRVRADLFFEPAPETSPLECDLGDDGSHPHTWILAASDNRVEGRISVRGPRKTEDLWFLGRGYHDHNAGAQEISLAMRRWAWGRAHLGPSAHVYYERETRSGQKSGLWITCEQGEPAEVLPVSSSSEEGRSGNIFGVRHGRSLKVEAGGKWLRDRRLLCVDDGPFYRRWTTRFEWPDGASVPGISELLDTRNLNRPLFNWMVPYRLKRPKA